MPAIIFESPRMESITFRGCLTIKDMKERFFSKADVKGLDDCWNWKRSKSKGYPNCAAWKASIIIWRILRGEIPKFDRRGRKVVLRHLCNNKKCVNPRHLALGTQVDNAHDYYQSLK